MHFQSLYPTQDNPTQATAILKYWLGGPDPLDYVDIYNAPAHAEAGSPAHWHYVSQGFCDISDGKGNVHPPAGAHVSVRTLPPPAIVPSCRDRLTPSLFPACLCTGYGCATHRVAQPPEWLRL